MIFVTFSLFWLATYSVFDMYVTMHISFLYALSEEIHVNIIINQNYIMKMDENVPYSAIINSGSGMWRGPVNYLGANTCSVCGYYSIWIKGLHDMPTIMMT